MSIQFENEIEITRKMNCEYVVKMMDYWVKNRKIYIVLELCEETLYKKVTYTKN